MPRPKTKADLITQSQGNYKKLLDYVDAFSTQEQLAEFPQGTLNRNIRDVLAHLNHWNLMMLKWYTLGMKGEKPAMPAEGYTWKTMPDLNRKIQERYNDTALEDIKGELVQSFERLQVIIAGHSNEELFTKKRYKWTGSTSLGAYLISTASSHYDWAYKLIKRIKKDKS
ncbi:ClbS/DfsB family four-helix bundle protein [Croceitalea rosinachiae]|uniref:ClbS/DfsB family four-helix bundle protein n=1 Tax=Croceitalea rosinachiae TaxID=3075596 RepID=A0ABU3A9K0_9FLAO|nr:ClbS/DfsB family four-helix bundle protein [Croceitalea sp. F388]MDT0605758.1 ClbS/DfsB family four-helix bundle protein [Croceitalea sp. F388]